MNVSFNIINLKLNLLRLLSLHSTNSPILRVLPYFIRYLNIYDLLPPFFRKISCTTSGRFFVFAGVSHAIEHFEITSIFQSYIKQEIFKGVRFSGAHTRKALLLEVSLYRLRQASAVPGSHNLKLICASVCLEKVI